MKRRVVGIGVAVIAAGVGFASQAQALDETIAGYALGGAGREWDFENSTAFAVSEGAIIEPGRVADDGFDSPSLAFEVETGGGAPGVTYKDPDGIGNYDRKHNSLTTSPATANGVTVSRVETAAGPYLRTLIKLQNSSSEDLDRIARWTADYGSDGAEEIQSSSSGDREADKKDRWFVTGETGANDFDDDPTLAFVLFGPGVDGKKDLNYIPLQVAGAGKLTVFMDFTVPARSSRYLMFFTEMHGNPKDAKKSMGKFDQKHLSKGLLDGISKKTQKQILNWDL